MDTWTEIQQQFCAIRASVDSALGCMWSMPTDVPVAWGCSGFNGAPMLLLAEDGKRPDFLDGPLGRFFIYLF
jgi:hypothetical protein